MPIQETEQYLVSLAGSVSGWDNPHEKLRKAFAGHEFILFSQSILRLLPTTEKRGHFEVFVRLREEEEQLVPPGTFLPMLEYCNLGPALDRYVVQHLIASYVRKPPQEWGVAHLNLCSSTFTDAEFCGFVAEQLVKSKVPAECLCFEFPGRDSNYPASAQTLARDLKKIGCRISVGAVDDESIGFGPIKDLQADFLKIGGSLIRDLPNNKSVVAEIKTAARACRTFGVQTIAVCVESAPTLKLLRQLNVDYAQGYGISRPGPMDRVATA